MRSSWGVTTAVFWGLIIFVGTAVGGFYFFPLAYYDNYRAYSLYYSGVIGHRTASFEVFEKSECDPSKSDCQCVLFLHGLGDEAYTWHRLFYEPHQKRKWSAHMVAINLPGSGNSPRPKTPHDYRMKTMAARLNKEVLPQCESWNVVGNSLGGWLGLRTAVDFPDQVRSVLIINSAGLSGDFSHVIEHFIAPTAQSVRRMEELSYSEQSRHYIAPPHIYDQVAERMKQLPIVEMLDAQEPEDFIDSDLENINVPVGIFWGTADKIIPLEFAEKFTAKLPYPMLHLADHCGHMPQVECPGDVWRMLQFMIDTSI